MSAVDLTTAKQYLQISHTAQDVVVQALIDGAEDYVERYCGVKLVEDDFEENLDGGERELLPTYLPLTAITEVSDNSNGGALWDAAIHRSGIRTTDAAGIITNVIWPDGAKRWHAEYSAGYAALPGALKLAILQLVFRSYQARGGETSNSAAGAAFNFGGDKAARVLLAPFRQRVAGVC